MTQPKCSALCRQRKTSYRPENIPEGIKVCSLPWSMIYSKGGMIFPRKYEDTWLLVQQLCLFYQHNTSKITVSLEIYTLDFIVLECTEILQESWKQNINLHLHGYKTRKIDSYENPFFFPVALLCKKLYLWTLFWVWCYCLFFFFWPVSY